MNLGLAEMRRSPVRYAAISGSVGFIVFLALILAALSDGLYLGATGAYRSTPATHWVFSPTAGFELSRSVIPADAVEKVSDIEGVETVGRLSSFSTPATSDGEELQVSLLGADDDTMPTALVDGRMPEPGAFEVVVDRQVLRRGIDIGSVINLNDGPDFEVVGVVEDAGFGFVTAWTHHDAFEEARREVRPEMAAMAGTTQALGVSGSFDPATLEQATGLAVATPEEAIDSIPGTAQQKSTLSGIVYTTFAVAAVVVGLFFALVTLEKRNEYAVLKAIGMPNRTLVGALIVQALVASAIGYLFGLVLARAVGAVLPASVPALFLNDTAITLLGTTLFMGALGAIFSFRRVTRIDPANALGGPA